MAAEADDESFITIGNPLPEIEEYEAIPKPVKFQEQGVKDAKGRPVRFHGAFTGGFSAGFFNTVSTPEGFQPGTFVSSRVKKAENVHHLHPEDFMDDEDFGEHGIAPKQIETTAKFESQAKSSQRQIRQAPRDGLLAGDMLAALIVPARLPIGVKLLRKLGWKEGQGIGPRRNKRKKNRAARSDGQKVYGCAPPPTASDGEEEESSEDEYASGLTFAPKDVNPISFKAKDNVHGIGYSGINPRSALTSGQDHFSLFDKPRAPSGARRKKGMTGQAFGVGALHDDDEDIYAQDNLSRYDFEIKEADPVDDLHGWTAPRQHAGAPNQSSSKVIEGFALASKKVFSSKLYPPPHLPRNYKPIHKAMQDMEHPAVDSKDGKERHDASSRSAVLSETPEFKSVFDLIPEADRKRMEALKPAKLPTRPNRWDVKEALSKDNKPKTDQSKDSTQGTSKPDVPVQKELTTSQPSLQSNQSASVNTESLPEPGSGSTSQQPSQDQNSGPPEQARQPLFQPAGGGFKPFAKTPEKQERYEAFLHAKKKGETYSWEAWKMMTDWEKEQEKEEFSKAAQLYGRVNAVMAARFTHGSTGGVLDTNIIEVKMETEAQDEQQKAADMKMYGKLTRETLEWHPHKNLCKLFNVPNPYPNSTVVGLLTVKKDKYSLFNLLHVPEDPELPSPPPNPPQKALPAPPSNAKPEKKKSIFTEEILEQVNQPTSTKNSEDTSSTTQDVVTMQTDTGVTATGAQNTAESDVPMTQTDTEERPPMDLFKAIFSGSSSESSDSEEEQDENSKQLPNENPKLPQTPSLPLGGLPVTVTSDVSTEPPSVAIDSDIESNKDSLESSESHDTQRVMSIRETGNSEGSLNESYGPSLPPELYGPLPPSNLMESTEKDNPVKSENSASSHKHISKEHRHKSSHKKDKKKKSKHKKEKKKKTKHKKSSHRKETKTKKYDSDSSSGDADSESGTDNVNELDLLSRLKNIPR